MTDFGDLEKPILGVPRMKPGERTRYVPNHRSFGAFIRSDQVRDPTEQVAEDIATMAAAKISHPAVGARSTGFHERVRAGFKVKRNAGFMKVAGNVRVKVEIVNEVPGAALVEFGGRGLSAQRTLGKAGGAHGDFKPEGGPS